MPTDERSAGTGGSGSNGVGSPRRIIPFPRNTRHPRRHPYLRDSLLVPLPPGMWSAYERMHSHIYSQHINHENQQCQYCGQRLP